MGCVVFATAGAGGELPSLVVAAPALRERDHDLLFVGDGAVNHELYDIGVSGRVLPPDLDLRPRLVAAIRDAMAERRAISPPRGPIVLDRMTAWADFVKNISSCSDGNSTASGQASGSATREQLPIRR